MLDAFAVPDAIENDRLLAVELLGNDDGDRLADDLFRRITE